MTQTIHLSRHGQTKQNAYHRQTGLYWSKECKGIGGFWDLSEKGLQQAHTLADYVSSILIPEHGLSPSDIIIVTSEEQRSRDTGEIVRVSAGIPIENTYSSKALNENVPLEWVAQTESDDPYYLRWLSKRVHLDEIAEMASSEFAMLSEKYPGKQIIAPLHNALNRAFLQKSAGFVMGDFGNCSLMTLEYNAGTYSIKGYPKTNDDLRSELEQRLGQAE